MSRKGIGTSHPYSDISDKILSPDGSNSPREQIILAKSVVSLHVACLKYKHRNVFENHVSFAACYGYL